MQRHGHRHPRFIVLAALATAWLSAGATSCRFFGNYSESQPATNQEDIGYYEMAPQHSSLSAVHSNRGILSKAVPFSAIPYDIVTATLSNPVIFWARAEAEGGAILASHENPGALQFPGMGWDPATDVIEFLATASVPGSAWNTKKCSYLSWIDVKGAIRRGAGPFFTGFQEPLAGRIQLHASSTTRFEGDCAAMLAQMQSCYSDVTQCGAATTVLNEERLSEVRAIYDKHIQNGVFATSDIERVTSIAYDVEYE